MWCLVCRLDGGLLQKVYTVLDKAGSSGLPQSQLATELQVRARDRFRNRGVIKKRTVIELGEPS